MISIGRTGALVPFAELEPVSVGGATVRLATLHNQEDVARKGLMIGDRVIVQRAGDVIPQVVGPLTQERTGDERPFVMPDRCPACDTPVVQPPGEVQIRCPNRSCPAQIVQGLFHFASRGAMDIEGLGEKTIHRFYGEGLLRSFADIYDLPAHRERPDRDGGLQGRLGGQPARRRSSARRSGPGRACSTASASATSGDVTAEARRGRVPVARRPAGGRRRRCSPRPRASGRSWPSRSASSCPPTPTGSSWSACAPPA